MDQYQYFENSNNPEQQQIIQDEIKTQAHNRYYDAAGVSVIGAFFKNIVNFKGRSSRREFWWSTLFVLILVISLTMLFTPIFLAFTIRSASVPFDQFEKSIHQTTLITTIVQSVIALPFAIAQCSLFLRRLRDVGHSQWLFWAYLVFALTTQILSFIYIYNLPNGSLLSDLKTAQTLRRMMEVSTSLMGLFNIGLFMVALFPNKPFKIEDDYYESNGQQIRVWSN